VQDALIGVSESLAQMYHHVMMVAGQTPDRLMLDHMNKLGACVREMGDELPSRETESSVESGTDTDVGRSPRILIAKPADRRVLEQRFVDSLKTKMSSEMRSKLDADEMNAALRASTGSNGASKERHVFHVVKIVGDQLKYAFYFCKPRPCADICGVPSRRRCRSRARHRRTTATATWRTRPPTSCRRRSTSSPCRT